MFLHGHILLFVLGILGIGRSRVSPTLGIVCLFYSSHPSRLKWSLTVTIPVLLTCPFPLAPEDFIRVFYNLHLAAGRLPFSSVTLNMK